MRTLGARIMPPPLPAITAPYSHTPMANGNGESGPIPEYNPRVWQHNIQDPPMMAVTVLRHVPWPGILLGCTIRFLGDGIGICPPPPRPAMSGNRRDFGGISSLTTRFPAGHYRLDLKQRLQCERVLV